MAATVLRPHSGARSNSAHRLPFMPRAGTAFVAGVVLAVGLVPGFASARPWGDPPGASGDAHGNSAGQGQGIAASRGEAGDASGNVSDGGDGSSAGDASEDGLGGEHRSDTADAHAADGNDNAGAANAFGLGEGAGTDASDLPPGNAYAYGHDEDGPPGNAFGLDDGAAGDAGVIAGGGDHKITICHIPPGNPENAHNITVDLHALEAHLAHGDPAGPCTGNEGGDDGEDGGPADHKVIVCHVPPGNPANAHTIPIDFHAVETHLGHGDSLGECPSGSDGPPRHENCHNGVDDDGDGLVDGEDTEDCVVICHDPRGRAQVELTLTPSGAAAHLAQHDGQHGEPLDTLGSCPPPGTSEDCDNGVDDDGDGLVDGDDPDCQDGNLPPVAVIDVECHRLVCDFDGTDSTDDDGEIVGYEWEINPTFTTPTVQFTYDSPGVKTVTLTVTDNEGATDTAEQTFTVSRGGGGGGGSDPQTVQLAQEAPGEAPPEGPPTIGPTNPAGPPPFTAARAALGAGDIDAATLPMPFFFLPKGLFSEWVAKTEPPEIYPHTSEVGAHSSWHSPNH